MKKFWLWIALGLVAAACSAQNVVPTTHYGFQLVTNVASSWTWTNNTAYPFKIDSAVFNSSVANTAVFQRVHPYKINQERGWVTTTNDMSEVESNYYAQVTNVVTVYVTNTMLSVTNAGAAVYTTDDIKQLFIHFGDILQWTFSDTSTNTLIINVVR